MSFQALVGRYGRREITGGYTMSGKIEFEKSSSNVFADMGLDNPDERSVKAKLAYAINGAIKARRLTQIKAAELLGIDQPKVSALARGRLSGFSIERLFKFLMTFDLDVQIRVQPKPVKRAAARMTATVPNFHENGATGARRVSARRNAAKRASA